MARGNSGGTPPPPDTRIDDTNVAAELKDSFLEYAFSVIYSRALPDARDGLKPVQRRILFQMAQMGLRPDRGHVKSARVVGEVMGRLHPHGDQAIYDALVRLSQSFSQRLPMIDGHGNFGSPDDGPAAMRYTECRLDNPALAMTSSLDEDVVDFVANYDGRETEPVVLPAAIPNLLVNGAAGIAVGMATNMAPHNLGEVVAAARHLLEHPDADTEALMRFVPGPDLPTGGIIIGRDGIREAYATGKGSFRMRAKTRIEQITPRKKGVVITELPYNVGPERVIEKIRALVQGKKIDGISDLVDLTDGDHGLRLELHIKNGFNPEAVLAKVFKATPLEEQFAINAVALVDGQPRTLGLRELLRVFLDHRLEVVRRRSEYRLMRARERLHLVEGLLIAILDIDEVIALIRSSEDAGEARQRLMTVFDLSEAQANYILDMPLRRLTKYSRLELETERDELTARIEDLTDILTNESRLRHEVSTELAEVASRYSTPRRTVLLDSEAAMAAPEVPLEVADDPCWVLLSNEGLVARTTAAEELGTQGPRASHDVIVSSVRATARGAVGLLTDRGMVHRLSVLDLPAIATGANRPSLGGGAPLGALIDLPQNEHVVALISLDTEGPGYVLGTRGGVVKRVTPDHPASLDSWEAIRLAAGDEVVGAADLGPRPASVETGTEGIGHPQGSWAVFVTSDAQLLRFDLTAVRAQGRQAGGVAGIRLAPGAEALFFGVPADPESAEVVTVAGSSEALPGTSPAIVKVTPLRLFPAKGRATGGVRCMRFVKGQDCLVRAWVGTAPSAAGSGGTPVDLPDPDLRRDGSGTATGSAIAGLGGAVG